MVAPETRAGQVWGRFRIIQTVGRGRRVLKVTDAETGESRALTIVPHRTGDAMLQDELEQLARLRHPSLPRVYEVGLTQEPIEDLPARSPFVLAEWIAGERCDARSCTGQDLGARVWTLLGDIAGALATLHAAGLVHGDIAPQNILVADDGRAVLVDLGVGSRHGARGTPGYMAPEALAGDLEPRSDLYGLGATIVRLVIGRPMLDAPGLGDLVSRTLAGGPPPELPGLPLPLADLVGRMVARDADARPISALAVLDELDRLAPAIAPGTPRRARPRLGSAPAPIAWPGAAAVIDAIARSLDGSAAVILVVGAAASGVRELVDGAIRRRRLQQVARGTRQGPATRAASTDDVAQAVDRVDDPRPAVRSLGSLEPARPTVRSLGSLEPARPAVRSLGSLEPARPAAWILGSLDEIGAAFAVQATIPSGTARSWIERVARAARRAGAPVVIELGDDPRAGDLIGALTRAEGGNPVIAIVDREPSAGPIHNDPSDRGALHLERAVAASSDGDIPRGADRPLAGSGEVVTRRSADRARAGSSMADPPAVHDPEALVGRVPFARRPGVVVHAAPILDRDGVAALATAMLGVAPPRAWAHALHVASSGLALAAIELLRSIAGEPQPFAVDWTARTTAGITELRTRQLRAAPAGARRVAAAIAAWGGRVRIDRALATLRVDGKAPSSLADVTELERLGLAHRRGDDVTIDRATAEAAEVTAGGDAIARLAGAALDGQARRDAERDSRVTERDPRVPARDPLRATERDAERDPQVPPRDPQVPARDAGHDAAAPSGRAAAQDGSAPEHTDRGGARAGAAGPAAIDRDLTLIAPLLERAVLDGGRAELACDAAEHLFARGRTDRALALAKRALAIAPARAGLVAARAAVAASAYRDAAVYAHDAEAAGADPVVARLISARAAQGAGELEAAEAVLAELHVTYPGHPAHGEVAGTYARLLVARGRYHDARAVATAAGPLAGLRAEAAGLAAFHFGELEAADAAFAALEVGAAVSGDSATVGRASSLRGMVAQHRGQLGLASDRYREAARRLGEVGELRAAATAELQLGAVLAERGRASEALPRLAAAVRVFAELGATTESCAAELSRGNALLLVGQVDDARTAAAAALAHAEAAPHLRAFAQIVAGEAGRRLGDEAAAIRNYREALAIGALRGDPSAQVSAYIALAEAGQRDGDGVAVEALCASDDERDRWILARGRLALRDPASVTTRPSGSLADATVELARACAEVAVRAVDADRLERGFRGHAIAAQLAHRARDAALARREAGHARVAHAALAAATAPAFRAAIDGDPDLARLPAADPSELARPARPGRGDPETAQLRRLLALSRRLSTEPLAEATTEASTERILDDVIDTAIELTSAERGFVLLRQPHGELAPVVSRNFLAGELDAAPAPSSVSRSITRSISRSIAERAAMTGEPVVTVDAGIDERFGAAASVAALPLRSVLAVPLRHRGAITGCLYVDHRLRGDAFDDAAASVLGELADIAAIAIDNARQAGDLRRATLEINQRNARLSTELAERDAELVRVKAELPDRDRLRRRYERIVGRSPAIVKMLDMIDRAAASSLPVVIVGEAGTGKELVARALHDHSPRKTGAFVALNCGAVPESLLESELFGDARGSFPGGERDHRGLFEVADGGTLFLDEIADTSLAIQARFLRALQDGEIRRIGDTRPRQVDVRVIAATQRSLGELASSGRFREDLRLRIDVISVPVPALRDRDGDLPLLVEHLLARLCAGKPMPRLTRAAMRALAQHRWPGNVRELENALARGVAMAGDVIDLADLPEAIAHAATRPEPTKPPVGEDLRLRPALTTTEQAYIAAAMARAKGNQTAAARLLGLSRFGLQKKLRRLAGADDDTD